MGRPLGSLKPRTRWLGRRIELYGSTDSTNLVAERLAAAGAPEGTLVLAEGQTAGRGRLGRAFFSPEGRGIYLSAILRPDEEPDSVHRYVFAAAVAVAASARERLAAERTIAIKWPNDVLVDGRKLSGINLPVRVEGGKVRWAILGVGINVGTAEEEFPPELRASATSLRIAAGREIDRVEFAEELIEALEREIERLRAAGFGAVLEGWRKFFRMRGERVRVGGPGVAREIEGTVEGVGPDGALLLRTASGIERALAGDVTLLRERR
jgi:BirA family biotin operon repressor/biotin-[acetyl-CoA-carboxylase] ligase